MPFVTTNQTTQSSRPAVRRGAQRRLLCAALYLALPASVVAVTLVGQPRDANWIRFAARSTAATGATTLSVPLSSRLTHVFLHRPGDPIPTHLLVGLGLLVVPTVLLWRVSESRLARSVATYGTLVVAVVESVVF